MENPNYYAIIPAFVRYAEITPNAKLLYGEITCLSNKSGVCFASNDYFSKLYRVSHKTVSCWVSELVKNGFIKSELIYRKGTREVEKRHLTICNHVEINLNEEKSFKEEIKKNNKGNCFVIPFEYIGFTDVWLKWKSYKLDELNQKYKTTATEQTAFNHLLELSNNNILRAEKIVNNAIANGWKGIHPLKEEKNQNDQRDYWANERRKDEAKARGKDELMETLTITM